VTASVCAASHLMVSPAQPGSTQKEVLGAPNRPEVERRRGKEPVVESSDWQKMCMPGCCKLRALWPELNCPKPNLGYCYVSCRAPMRTRFPCWRSPTPLEQTWLKHFLTWRRKPKGTRAWKESAVREAPAPKMLAQARPSMVSPALGERQATRCSTSTRG